ncbi:MAG: metal ABC transporter substrate-binding protein [Elusimicrobia bacterium]|nr:metal ABC transporter substrate-binding protein [Elusimicrobiota bacterium]
MKRILNLITGAFLCLAVFSVCSLADNKINVVTTTLDAADFVKQIGGEKVSVYSIHNGQYDFHFFEPRPSEVIKLKKADVLVVYGLTFDAWLASLVDAARNPNIFFGATGYIDMADGCHAMAVPVGSRVDKRMGDVHPFGACGYLYTLENAKNAVENIYRGLVRVDSENAEYYEKNKNEYLLKLEETFNKLKQKTSEFHGTNFIIFHESWLYFADTFGFNIVGALEPKPGIPPSPAHLSKLIDTIKKENVRFILAEPYYPRKPIKFVSERTGIKEITVAIYCGGIKNKTTFIENIEYTVDTIIETLKK